MQNSETHSALSATSADGVPDRAAAGHVVDAVVVDAVVVGAGFGGMYMLYKLRELGLSARVFEAGTDVGGTWYWNRYPGARCDVESMEYSYSFDDDLQQEWQWSERFAAQPEILRYAQHVADRFDLRADISFETRVESATFDEATARWRVRASDGTVTEATWFIPAVGCLSSTNIPDFAGVDDFAGTVVHTGQWPKEGVDLAGKRVGIIGNGSSGVQAIPVIAEQCAHLTLFQRTAQYTVPARNRPLDPAEADEIKSRYAEFRAANESTPNAISAKAATSRERALESDADTVRAGLEARWETGGTQFMGAFRDLLFDQDANDLAAEFVRGKIADIVTDPRKADLLTPTHTIGCKRLVIDTNYYATFNQEHVDIVDVSAEPIEAITARGLRAGGIEHEFDVLIFATGFDAMTGSLLRMDVTGRDGVGLDEAWAAGPRTFLGLAVAGFPNMFIIAGPGSPSVLANMIVAIEQHVDWIGDTITAMRERGAATIETTDDVAEEWVAHVNAIADRTLFPTCNSWYLGANVPGKARVFMPLLGFPKYKARCDQVAANDYEGFVVV